MSFTATERLALLEANMTTVRAQAKRLLRTWRLTVVDYDDLLQAGAIGMLDAMDKFDVERGVPFGVYARFRIRGAMLDALVAAVPPGSTQVFGLDEQRPEPAIPSDAAAIERRLLLEQVLRRLPEREREVVRAYVSGSGGLGRFARRHSITDSRASQIKVRAVGIARRLFERKGSTGNDAAGNG